jgi:hypothetical protein
MNETVESKLNSIASTLSQAIYESEMAIGDNTKGYPYAAGYSRSALKLVLNEIEELQNLLTK